MKKFVNSKMDMVSVAKNNNNFKSREVPYNLKELAKDCFSSQDLLEMACDLIKSEKKPNFYDTFALRKNTDSVLQLIVHYLDLPNDFEFGFKDSENLENVNVDIEDQLSILKNMESDLLSALKKLKQAKQILDLKRDNIECALHNFEYADEIDAENRENQYIN
tara:strand:+ start:4000 stop:4488 length:489 start_codon:yes stop_codon:yes gene_type:complete